MTEKEINRILDELTKLEKKVDAQNKLLNGNGKIGISEMSRRAYEYMIATKKSKNGFYDWVFRAIVLMGIGFIAREIGLK